MRKIILNIVAAVLLAGALINSAAAQDAVKGKAVFDANCAACHSVHEQVVGPALKDVHKRRDEKWITNFVKNSSKVIASGDKQAVELFEKFGKTQMTSFEGTLSEGDIKDVVAFIKEESDKPQVIMDDTGLIVDSKTAAAAPASESFSWKALHPTYQILTVLFSFLVIMVLLFLFMTFFQALPLLEKIYDKPALKDSAMARFIALLRGDTTTITGKAKDEVMEDHSYDGIFEFDNDLPPWWKYTFYVTIVFGIIYLLNYHVLGGELQTQEYEIEMQQAALLSAKSGGDANEKTDFKPLTDVAQLEAGHKTFTQNCAACHGQKAEGMVGPNLTDDYWLHGSDVNGIYKTVKYGVTSKGMVAWQGKLTNEQILEVSCYILSLKGSNPPNAKAPQGEKVK